MTIKDFFEAHVDAARTQTGCKVPVFMGIIKEAEARLVQSATYLKWDDAVRKHVPVKIVIAKQFVEKCFTDGGEGTEKELRNEICCEMDSAEGMWLHCRGHIGQSFVGMAPALFVKGETAIKRGNQTISLNIPHWPTTAPWNPEA
jgi:hypothetical protein